MKYCRSCNLYYQVPLNNCMFCNNETEDRRLPEDCCLNRLDQPQPLSARYTPVIRENPWKRILYKLLTFALIISAGFCLYYDLSEKEPWRLSWSIIVIASGVYLILFLSVFFGNLNLAKKVIYLVLLTSLELTLIGIAIRNLTWVLDFIFPFTIITCLTFATVLLVFGKQKLHDYAIYVVNLCLLGFLPLLFLLLGLIHLKWPSLAATLQCLITLLGLVFFSGKKLLEELKRRIHI